MQWTMKTVDKAVWDLIHERQANPTDTDDLLNLLLQRQPTRRARCRSSASATRSRRSCSPGHETTANALAWMWYLLALNPEARDRMLEEVDAVLGDRRPTVDDIPQLPWTTACFQEAMRFYPPAWVIPRTCVEDDVIDGHRIPKGATVVIPMLHDAPRRALLARPRGLRPDALPGRERARAPSLGLRAVRRRASASASGRASR